MRKIYILYMATISILSLVYINNTSALDYSSNVGIGFTFNPTLSVNISPSDLTISNLSPGTTADSNIINVSVATNAAYGYTLSANVNNESLVHSNNINTFNSIATDADLSDLEDSEDANIWGYSTSLDSGTTWSNYNGLSNSSNTALINTNSNTSSNLDFKIAAKAASTQPSGTYAGTINFTAVSNVAPMSLLDSFIASGAEQLNGYYKMQDMTYDICEAVDIEESELQLIDVRDNKIYWVAKLKDGNCWMTQNLDLDITASSTALNSNNTDISTDESIYTATNTIYTLKGESDTYGYTYENGIATWIPERNTITYSQLNSTTWTNDGNHPYSYDRLNISTGEPVYPDGNVSQALAGDHGLSGNYYNWTASVASNDSSNTNSANPDPANSICPKGWRLPNIVNQEFGNLLVQHGIIETNTSITYLEGGFDKMGATSLYLVRGGNINNGSLNNSGSYGSYWSSTSYNNGNRAYHLRFGSNDVNPHYSNNKGFGYSIRCLDR